MSTGKNILITGASGFIGGHITRFFAAKEKNIYCLVRSGSDLSFIRDLPVQFIYGDICDPGRMGEALAGMDAVIHTAGMACDWGKSGDFRRVNVEGTLNILRAALTRGIKQIIITGSVSSYGEENHKGLKDENSPYQPHYPYAFDFIFPSSMNYYRESKALMTRLAIEFAAVHHLNLTIIEPVWVFGEHEFNTGFYEYLRTVSGGMPFMPGSRKNTFHVIYAGELARAYYHAYLADLKGVVRIIAGDDEPVLMHELFGRFCEAAGLKKPRFLPKAIIYPVAFLLELFYSLFGAKHPLLLTRARVNMFYDSIGYKSINASRLIGFRNQLSRGDCIDRTVKWYKQNHYL